MRDMTFAEKISRLCDQRKWKQSHLASEAGVPPSSLSNWWKSKSEPSLESALKIARTLGVSLEYLADENLDWPPAENELADDEAKVLETYRYHRDHEGLNRIAAEAAMARAARENLPVANHRLSQQHDVAGRGQNYDTQTLERVPPPGATTPKSKAR